MFLYRWANAFWIFDIFTFLKCPIPQILLKSVFFCFFCQNRGRPKGGPKILVHINRFPRARGFGLSLSPELVQGSFL